MTSGEGPTKASPACSTLRANSAFSDRNPYLRGQVSTRARGNTGVCSLPRVDHVHTMFQGDPNYVILGKVRGNRS